jgi:hypothetical protein
LTLVLNAQTNSALREELLKMRQVDQQARAKCAQGTGDEQIKCLVETLEKIDKPNTRRLEEIFNQSGFPTARTVGKDGVEAFMLLLQHAPDETLRQKSLNPVKKAFKRKEITPSEFAGFVDRLLIRQGKPQIYGSNFDIRDNKLVMSKVKDRKNLDRRRHKIGLPPIAAYAKTMKEFYNLEVEISN